MEIVQTSVQANVPNNESTKDAKEPIKGSRHSQTSSKAANCDIEGMKCKEPPSWILLRATHPTRCTGHKMPDMVKCTKEVVPLTINAAGHAVDVVQKAKKQVMFKKAMEVVDAWILSAPGTPETANFSQKSVGDSFGKPSASLVKQHICREIPAETRPLLPLIQKMMTLWQCFVQIMPNAKGPLYKSNQN